MNSNSVVHIVDDDESFRESLSFMISSFGYRTETYTHGRDFIDRYKPSTNECLIIDVAMPEMTGNELFEYISDNGFLIAAIFLSAHGDIPMAVKAIKKGAIDFLVKPFKSEELLSAISSALKKTTAMKENQKINSQFKHKVRRLTQKERKVFVLMAKKKSIAQMANEFKRAESTIEKHRMSVLKKLGFSNTDDLAWFCEKNGVFSEEK